MFVKSDIRKVEIAVEKTSYPDVCLGLGKAGIIHIFRSKGMDAMSDAGLKDEDERARRILAAIEYSLSALNMVPGGTGAAGIRPDAGRDASFVSRAARAIERFQRLESKIREKEGIIAAQISYAEALTRMGIDCGAHHAARLVKTVFGTVADTDLEVPADEGFVVDVSGGYAFGACLPGDFSAMMLFLKKYGFMDLSSDLPSVSLDGLEKRLAVLRRRREVLERYLEGLKSATGPALVRLYGEYTGYMEVIRAMQMSLFSSRAVFITGWIDARDMDVLNGILKGACGERYVVSESKDPDAPVRLMNSRLFRPFELIVKTMGMPANSEIDPTPLTALTFVLMFGLMFGDLGQGLVLALIGMVIRRFAHKKGTSGSDLASTGGILIVCGLASAVVGLLYGSIFSNEHIMRALWFHPMEHIMRLFSLTVSMGALFMAFGLIVNIANRLMNSDYSEAFLGKRGLVVLVAYSATVLFAVRYMTYGKAPAQNEVLAFIGVPLVLFCSRGFLGPALFRARRPEDMAEYVIETVMDILETCIGMFANTVSFIRVGAFALSHAGLSIVTYTLAAIIDPAFRSAAAVMVIVLGNIFIIGFEGLVCGIQSMRLEYYEFFSKFFTGDGIPFNPFILKVKTSEV